MIEFIIGSKGKGKTKILLSKAAEAIEIANGNVVYIDKNTQHMYELSNRIRLINISNFPIENEDHFIGFISGIVSQDHDLEYMFLDSFLTIAGLTGKDIRKTVAKLDQLSIKYNIHFIISVSMDQHDLPEELQKFVSVAL